MCLPGSSDIQFPSSSVSAELNVSCQDIGRFRVTVKPF